MEIVSTSGSIFGRGGILHLADPDRSQRMPHASARKKTGAISIYRFLPGRRARQNGRIAFTVNGSGRPSTQDRDDQRIGNGNPTYSSYASRSDPSARSQGVADAPSCRPPWNYGFSCQIPIVARAQRTPPTCYLPFRTVAAYDADLNRTDSSGEARLTAPLSRP